MAPFEDPSALVIKNLAWQPQSMFDVQPREFYSFPGEPGSEADQTKGRILPGANRYTNNSYMALTVVRRELVFFAVDLSTTYQEPRRHMITL
jgi:hypothetical protein